MSKPIRPQTPPALRQKTAARPLIQQKRTPPAAPPVYRPQPAPKCLQPKAATPQQQPPPVRVKTVPAPPPVYRPQPVPKVLQRKPATIQQPPVGATKLSPSAPPVFRPQPAPRVLQTKQRAGQSSTAQVKRPAPMPPPGYKPNKQSHVLQRATSAGHPRALASRGTIQRKGGGQVIQLLTGTVKLNAGSNELMLSVPDGRGPGRPGWFIIPDVGGGRYSENQQYDFEPGEEGRGGYMTATYIRPVGMPLSIFLPGSVSSVSVSVPKSAVKGPIISNNNNIMDDYSFGSDDFEEDDFEEKLPFFDADEMGMGGFEGKFSEGKYYQSGMQTRHSTKLDKSKKAMIMEIPAKFFVEEGFWDHHLEICDNPLEYEDIALAKAIERNKTNSTVFMTKKQRTDLCENIKARNLSNEYTGKERWEKTQDSYTAITCERLNGNFAVTSTVTRPILYLLRPRRIQNPSGDAVKIYSVKHYKG